MKQRCTLVVLMLLICLSIFGQQPQIVSIQGQPQKTSTQVSTNQQESIKQLQTENDDVDLSQIIIDYTAAYTAYQASLTAAGKLGDSTLLNYI